MKMTKSRAPLGELCSLVKGTSAISKTPSGPYPLVTTGDTRKTANTFQFDGDAVCIPLISSTGHGHASLKRVHFQTGKFALANLLVAAFVKHPSILSARFLMRYLMFMKDSLIVPLMTGTANMGISIDRLASIPIEFPSLREQERIVALLDRVDELKSVRAEADARTSGLIAALFHQTFGVPTDKNSSWPIVPIKHLGKVVTGNTPPRKDPKLYGSFIDWIKTDNIDATTGIVAQATERLSEEGATRARVVPIGSVLVTCIAGSRDRLGDAAITDRMVAINQQINAIVPDERTDSEFLCALISALKPVIRFRAGGVMTGIINKTSLEEIRTIRPPFSLQRQFGRRAAALRAVKVEQRKCRKRIDHLFQSIAQRALWW